MCLREPLFHGALVQLTHCALEDARQIATWVLVPEQVLQLFELVVRLLVQHKLQLESVRAERCDRRARRN